MMNVLRMLLFTAAGLSVGYVTALVLKRKPVGPRSPWRVGLLVVGGVLGLYLGFATAAWEPTVVPPDPQGEPAPTAPTQTPTAPVAIKVLANEREFDQFVANTSTPILVDFYADWCPPCRVLAPILKDLSLTWGDRIAFAKVNVDASRALARRFGIEVLPTLVLVRGDQEIRRIRGAPPRGELERILGQVAAGSAN